MKGYTKSKDSCQLFIKSTQSSLDERLSEIKLDQSKIDEIKNDKIDDTIIDKTLGLFKIGEILQTILNWNKDVNEEIKKEKERRLISDFLNKVDENQLKLNVVIDFFNNPLGLILTNKILEIGNQLPPDADLLMDFSNVLKNIVISDFVSLYSKHIFIINIIGKLSPQSLIILKDYKNWPTFKVKGKIYRIEMDEIKTPWTSDFAISYIKKKGLDNNDASLLNMLNYSTFSLLTNNLIISDTSRENYGVKMTDLGKELIDYLK